MKASPLDLEGYFVRELFVELNPKFEKSVDSSAWRGYHYQPEGNAFKPDLTPFSVSVKVGYKKDEATRWSFSLTVESQKNTKKIFPYSFRISLDGYFSIDDDYPAESGMMLLHANAPGLLYGAAREILATVTGRGLYPAVVLPTVTFIDNAEKITTRAMQQLKTALAKQLGPAPQEKPVKAKRASKKGSNKKKPG
jgi:preprotein translocase subunit SecB